MIFRLPLIALHGGQNGKVLLEAIEMAKVPARSCHCGPSESTWLSGAFVCLCHHVDRAPDLKTLVACHYLFHPYSMPFL